LNQPKLALEKYQECFNINQAIYAETGIIISQ